MFNSCWTFIKESVRVKQPHDTNVTIFRTKSTRNEQKKSTEYIKATKEEYRFSMEQRVQNAFVSKYRFPSYFSYINFCVFVEPTKVPYPRKKTRIQQHYYNIALRILYNSRNNVIMHIVSEICSEAARKFDAVGTEFSMLKLSAPNYVRFALATQDEVFFSSYHRMTLPRSFWHILCIIFLLFSSFNFVLLLLFFWHRLLFI